LLYNINTLFGQPTEIESTAPARNAIVGRRSSDERCLLKT
jgi:hypothetical protein